jgi:D-sedoheptulose 7-phosphate isomerase
MADEQARVRALFDATIALHQRIASEGFDGVLQAAAAIRAAQADGCTVLIFGNGGSAADAQHMAAELVGRYQRERPALAAIALTTDTSVLSAIGNDYDVALGISTGGASANVLAGLEAARAQGLKTIALTGRDGGAIGRAAEIHVNVPDESTARVQEVHRTLIHALCELIEGS